MSSPSQQDRLFLSVENVILGVLFFLRTAPENVFAEVTKRETTLMVTMLDQIKISLMIIRNPIFILQ